MPFRPSSQGCRTKMKTPQYTVIKTYRTVYILSIQLTPSLPEFQALAPIPNA